MNEHLPAGGTLQAFRAEGATYVWGNVVTELHIGHEFPITFSALALHNRGRRDGEMQYMQENNTYGQFESANIPVTALNNEDTDQALPVYPEADLERIDRFVRANGVVTTLEEYPMRALMQLDRQGLPPVVVNAYRSGHNKTGTDIVHLQEGLANGLIAAVTVDAYASKAAYVERGIPDTAITVVPNGIDTKRFKPSSEGRDEVRRELGIGVDDPVVLLIARDSPEKNIPLFLDSSVAYLQANPKAHVVMAGAGLGLENENMRQLVAARFGDDESLRVRLHALGQRPDLPAVYASGDVLALTSSTESRPLCISEAFAAGVRVAVSTGVGDAPEMIGEHGYITDSNPEEIASKWAEAYARRDEIGFDISHRDDLGLAPMVRRYARVIFGAVG